MLEGEVIIGISVVFEVGWFGYKTLDVCFKSGFRMGRVLISLVVNVDFVLRKWLLLKNRRTIT